MIVISVLDSVFDAAGNEAVDILSRRSKVGQQSIIQRMQFAYGDPAQAPIGKPADKGFGHECSPLLKNNAAAGPGKQLE
jgi:hypothetical protein